MSYVAFLFIWNRIIFFITSHYSGIILDFLADDH